MIILPCNLMTFSMYLFTCTYIYSGVFHWCLKPWRSSKVFHSSDHEQHITIGKGTGDGSHDHPNVAGRPFHKSLPIMASWAGFELTDISKGSSWSHGVLTSQSRKLLWLASLLCLSSCSCATPYQWPSCLTRRPRHWWALANDVATQNNVESA